MEPRRPIAWNKGGEAELVAIDGEKVTLRSTVPSPPGSRIEGTVRLGGEGDATSVQDARILRVKIHGSKKQPDGWFVLEGRALDLTRDLREALVELSAARGAT